MTFPVVEGAVSNGVGLVGSIDITLPAGVTAGDLLIIAAVGQQPNPRTFNPPAGFTTLFNDAGPGNLRFFYGGYKISDGSEGAAVTGTVGGGDARIAALAYRISGYQGTPEASAIATGSSAAPNPPSLSPSWGTSDTLWIAMSGTQPNTSQTAPSNYTDLISQDNSGSALVSIFSARRMLAASSEDPGAFGASQTNAVAATIAIQGLGSVGAFRQMMHYRRLRA